jgi:hypothetical protein
MKAILTSVVLTIGLLSPSFAQNGQGQNGYQGGQTGQHEDRPRGAPAPLLGAGIPGLAIGLGYGVYWLVRRRRSVG